jgi:hypothetical protein
MTSPVIGHRVPREPGLTSATVPAFERVTSSGSRSRAAHLPGPAR